MKYYLRRLTVGDIEDITKVALAGTIEIAEMQPEIHILGQAKFQQKFTKKNRINVTTPARNNFKIPH